MVAKVRVSVRRQSNYARISKRLASASTRTLYQSAGYVRKVARSKIRRRRKSSRPGQPPSDHGFLKRSLNFRVLATRGFAVVGYEQRGNPAIPRALERGGVTTARRTFSGHRQMVRQRVLARPVLGPSLRESSNKLRQITFENLRKVFTR